MLHLIATSKKETPREKIIEAVSCLEGAFSLVILTDDAMYAIRDPNGPFSSQLGPSLRCVHSIYSCLAHVLVITVSNPRVGLRPLVLARIGGEDRLGGAGYLLSSETCAFDLVRFNHNVTLLQHAFYWWKMCADMIH